MHTQSFCTRWHANQQDAEAVAMRAAMEQWPLEAGYAQHFVSLLEITQAMIKEFSR